MSIVVVVKKNNKIVIAADRNYSVGSINIKSTYLRNRSKIRSFKDAYIGSVGATAHEHVIADLLDRYKDELSFDSESEIFTSYLRMHGILKEEYYLNTFDGEEHPDYESSQIDALIASPNGIFGMYTWREVYEYERFWAIGSGRNLALGSLFSTYELLDDAEAIAKIAISAACEFDDGCELPLDIHSISAA